MGLFSKSEPVETFVFPAEPFANGWESFSIPPNLQVDTVSVVKLPDGTESVQVVVTPKPDAAPVVLAEVIVSR